MDSADRGYRCQHLFIGLVWNGILVLIKCCSVSADMDTFAIGKMGRAMVETESDTCL